MKKLSLRKTILNIVGCALVLGIVLINSAQATVILKVLDSSRQPMPDVTVQLKTVGMGLDRTQEFKTNCAGRVTIGHFCIGGSCCASVSVTYSVSASNYTFDPRIGVVPCGGLTEVREVIASGPPQPARPVTTVSAASYLTASPSDSIAAAFGANLATTTEFAASLPLPTTLAGRTVLVKDINGVEKTAPLFFVSPLQINFLMPEGLASGNGSVSVVGADRPPMGGCVTVRKVAPSLFAANADGQGVAAAVALRVKSDGSQIFEPVAQFDMSQNRFVALPIDLGPDLGPATDRVFLVLFGSGLRNRDPLSNVFVRIGGQQASPEFAGAQGKFPGLDQIHIK